MTKIIVNKGPKKKRKKTEKVCKKNVKKNDYESVAPYEDSALHLGLPI